MLAKIDGRTVYADCRFTHGHKIKTRSRHDDVGVEMLARLQLDTGLGELVDMVGHNLRLTR